MEVGRRTSSPTSQSGVMVSQARISRVSFNGIRFRQGGSNPLRINFAFCDGESAADCSPRTGGSVGLNAKITSEVKPKVD